MGLVLAIGPAWGGTEPTAAAATPTTRPAGPNSLEKDRLIAFNFQKADIDAVLAYLSKVAGVTFLKETTVSGEVTIVSQKDLTVANAFHLLNAVLKVKGATCIVNDSRLVKIVPLSEAKRRDLPVYVAPDEDDLPRGESFVHVVVPLSRAKAKTLAAELGKLVGAYGDLSAATQGNCLIITDSATNVRKLLRIIRQADTDPEAVADMRVFILTHADARKVADVLKQIFAQPARRGSRTPTPTFVWRGRSVRGSTGTATPSDDAGAAIAARITIDDRLNAVVVVAAADQMKQIERLIAELDVPPEVARIVCEVITLEHGDCTEMAKTLKEVFQPTRTTRGRTTRPPTVPEPIWRRIRSALQPAAGAQSGPASDEQLTVTTDRRTNAIILVGTRDQVEVAKQIIEKLSADEGEQMDMLLIELKNTKARDVERALRRVFREANQAARRLVPSGSRGAPQTAGQVGAPGIAGETVIVADETANILLVVSNPRNFPRIQEYVAQLDQPKPQVFIQVLIGEITLDDDTKLGVDFSYLDEPFRHKQGSAAWKMDFGVSADLSGGSVTIDYRDMDIVLRALETEGKLHVISRPYILTRDNQTARIADAERVPFVRSTRATEEGSVFNTFQYEDVGIILQVTPQINSDGYVNLVIEQEISRITGRTVPTGGGENMPTFSTRSVNTAVSIRDGQTIIIGGLIADSEVTTVEEVPFLGKLPLIGAAFRNSVVTTQRKELVLILTPYVVRDEAQLKALSDRRRASGAFKDLSTAPDAPDAR